MPVIIRVRLILLISFVANVCWARCIESDIMNPVFCASVRTKSVIDLKGCYFNIEIENLGELKKIDERFPRSFLLLEKKNNYKAKLSKKLCKMEELSSQIVILEKICNDNQSIFDSLPIFIKKIIGMDYIKPEILVSESLTLKGGSVLGADVECRK